MEGINRIQPINQVHEVAGVQPVGKYWVSSSHLWNIKQTREGLNRNAGIRSVGKNDITFKEVLEQVMSGD